jgi:hypothetical protein
MTGTGVVGADLARVSGGKACEIASGARSSSRDRQLAGSLVPRAEIWRQGGSHEVRKPQITLSLILLPRSRPMTSPR